MRTYIRAFVRSYLCTFNVFAPSCLLYKAVFSTLWGGQALDGLRLPLALLFMIGTALALLINYNNKEQQGRIVANGANAMPVVSMVFAAGIFMGILSGTKMVDAMSKMIIASMPETWGPHFPLITALISLPGTFFMTNDAFYFGVLPVLAKAAATYGIPADEMGRAALIGQGSHLLSPLVPSTYLLVGLNKVEFGDLQKFALLPAICVYRPAPVLTQRTKNTPRKTGALSCAGRAAAYMLSGLVVLAVEAGRIGSCRAAVGTVPVSDFRKATISAFSSLLKLRPSWMRPMISTACDNVFASPSWKYG